MKVFSRMLFVISLFLISTYCFSQTPIQRWEFVRKGNEERKQILEGYNVGVSREGYVCTSVFHNEKFPMILAVDQNGSHIFTYIFRIPTLANKIYNIRSEAADIYKNSVYDDTWTFGIQTTCTDSTNTIYFPINTYWSRIFDGPRGNELWGFGYDRNEYFHSMIYTLKEIEVRFISRTNGDNHNDSINFITNIYEQKNDGKLYRTLDSISLGTIHKDDFVSLPKPKAMRWYPKNRQLGMMISADTVIPTSKTFTQVRTSKTIEKFDEVVDINPYLVENFAGKRLRWKGFTNSSFGFVALYENIDDNNRNILIRYTTATQTFTTVPLDASVDCRSLCIDSIGALAIVGTNNNAGNNDFYLGYFNSMGELSEQSWGGDEYDRLNDCVFDSLGEIAVSGQKGNDLYLAKFTFNATSVSDKGANSVPSIFIHQGTSSTANNELVVDNLPSGNTTIRMYTMQGTFVGNIYEGMIQEGATYRFPLPSSSISNGVYLIVLENNGITQTKQFVVVK